MPTHTALADIRIDDCEDWRYHKKNLLSYLLSHIIPGAVHLLDKNFKLQVTTRKWKFLQDRIDLKSQHFKAWKHPFPSHISPSLPWFALICLDLPWFALICLDLPCAMLQRKRKGLPRTALLLSSKTPDRMWREWSVHTLCIFFVLGKDLWWHYCSERVSRLYSWLPYRMSLCRRSCEGRLNLCRWGELLRIGDTVENTLNIYNDNNDNR